MLDPQPVEIWLDDDEAVAVAMVPAESISGWTLAMTVAAANSDPLKTYAVIVTDSPTGHFEFLVSPDTDGLTPGTYLYRVRRTDTGARETLAWGSLTVKARS